MDRDRVLLFCAAVAFAVVVVLWLIARWKRFAGSRRARARSRRAIRGEGAAEQLLERAGYRICERQVALTWWISCDGVDHPVELRADLLVEKGGARFVAEAKTGAAAPRLTTAATRRQLLEYLIAYEVDGVLLVDAEQASIHCVEFPLRRVDRAASPPTM